MCYLTCTSKINSLWPSVVTSVKYVMLLPLCVSVSRLTEKSCRIFILEWGTWLATADRLRWSDVATGFLNVIVPLWIEQIYESYWQLSKSSTNSYEFFLNGEISQQQKKTFYSAAELDHDPDWKKLPMQDRTIMTTVLGRLWAALTDVCCIQVIPLWVTTYADGRQHLVIYGQLCGDR